MALKQVIGPIVGSLGSQRTRGKGKTYEEEYLAEVAHGFTDNVLKAIYQDARIPREGQPYRWDNEAVCEKAHIRQLPNHKWMYRVRISYATPGATGKGPEESGPPSEWPIKSATEWSERLEYRATDLDGKAFQNTAGTPLVPPPAIPRWEPTLVLTYNTLSFSIAAMDAYAGAINSGTWFGYPAYTWRCVPRGTIEATDSEGQRYLQVAVAFERSYDPEKGIGLWHPHVEQNVGFYHLETQNVAGERKLVHITDDNGNPIVEPKYLDATGHHDPTKSSYWLREINFRTRRATSFAIFDILLAGAGLPP